MTESILKAASLYHVYQSKAEDGNVVALRGIHIDVKEGEAIAVVGPSGSGKSTLMKCLGGLMKPSSGSVMLAGKNMTRLSGKELVHLRQKTVSFIFQEGNLLPNLNARDNVAQPLRHQGISSRKALKQADERPAEYAADRGPQFDPPDPEPDDFAKGGLAGMLGE